MKRQSLVVLAMAIAAAGAAGCFKDPVSNLRGGPALLSFDHSILFLHPGDSTGVVATLMDKQANVLEAAGATWTAADPTVATVRKDTSVAIPGDYFTRAFIRGVAAGITHITVTARGVSDTIHVNVVPTSFTGAVAFSPNNKRVFDTVTVSAPSGLSFSTGASPSLVILGTPKVYGDTARVISRTASQIKVAPWRGGSGPLTVTNLTLGQLKIPSLSTASGVAIDSVASDAPNEPGNNAQATANNLVIDTTNTKTNPVIVYGTVNPGSDAADYWTFTTTAARKISVTLTWFGTGNPYGGDVQSPDLDAIVCNVGLACDESVPDLLGYAAASVSMPETGQTATLPAAQYWIGIFGFVSPFTIVYQLKVSLDP